MEISLDVGKKISNGQMIELGAEDNRSLPKFNTILLSLWLPHETSA
jgi:hypothetical protein